MKVVRIVVPPDKSISQRAIMLASISEGITRIKNLLLGNDCLRVIEAFRSMGVRIDVAAVSHTAGLPAQGSAATDIVVYGVGMHGLKKPTKALFMGNSGTAMRILPGILAGQSFEAVLKGDTSLSKRPMGRIVEPLRKMGAEIDVAAVSHTAGLPAQGAAATSIREDIRPPLKIHGAKLKAIKYRTKIASAQVKSCILLAGLYAKGITSVTEPVKSRDHTERMLRQFGVKLFSARSARSKNIVRAKSRTIKLKGPVNLISPGTIEIPCDISSAAFFIVAGCILPGMKIILKNVGLNPTRTGVIDILKKMGADIKVHSSRFTVHSFEPIGDIVVRSCGLKGVRISAKEVVRAIDEIPIIAVAACFAKGATVIEGISELRVKETDRVKSMVMNLRKLGADVSVNGSQLTVHGGKLLHAAAVSSFGDHRTAMSMLIAGLVVKGIKVKGLSCIDKSFPCFLETVRKLN